LRRHEGEKFGHTSFEQSADVVVLAGRAIGSAAAEILRQCVQTAESNKGMATAEEVFIVVLEGLFAINGSFLETFLRE